MKLSHLREGEAGRFTEKCKEWAGMKGVRFIVTDRFPEDRSSGGTTIVTEKGNQFSFLWEYHDPEVEKIGTGRVETTVVFNQEDI